MPPYATTRGSSRLFAEPGWWRFAPLLSAIAVYAAAVLTFGVGFVLFPVALGTTALAFRRTARPRGLVFWLGTVASALVTAAGLVTAGFLLFLLVTGELS